MKLQITLLLNLLFFVSLAQESQIINAYNLRYINYEKSLTIQQEIELNSEKNKDKETNFISNCFLTLTYLREKKLQLAKNAIDKATKLFPEIKNDNALGYYYYALYRFKYFIDQGNLEDDLLKALSNFEKSKNYYFASLTAISIANSGEYINKKFLDKGKQYALLANSNDLKLEAQICESTYMKERFNSKSGITTHIIESFEKSIQLTKKPTSNKMNVAVAYLNYANFLASKNEKEWKIIELTDTALFYAEKYNILSVVRNCYGVKGLYYLNQHKLDEAEQSFLKGIHYLKSLPFKEYETEKKFYQDLKEIANTRKDFVAYYQYDVLFQEANNLANANEKENAIQNAIVKYDLKNSEDKIVQLSKENKLKDWLIFSSISALILGYGLFFFFRKSTLIKQALLEQNKNEIQKEKKQVQIELMNSVLHLEKKNEILNELKENLLDQNKEHTATIHTKIFKTIDAGLAIDDDFEKFKNNFNSIYPDFFHRLQEKANQSLTQLDLKYCGFILMKVTNKEMATQMNVEPKSIRMARYRIKQKLQLAKSEDLDDFIQSAK